MSPTTLQEQTFQEDFSAGMNRDVAPHLIDTTAFYDGQNVVLDDDGSAYRRGGSKPFSVNDLDGPGRFLFDGILNVGRRTIAADQSKTYVLEGDDETFIELDSSVGMPYPKQVAVMKGLLFGGGGWITAGARSSTVHTVTGQLTLSKGSKTVTRSGGSWSGIVVPGHLLRQGPRVYEVASIESGTSLTLREPYEGATTAGQTGTFYPIYRHVSGDAYKGDEFVCVCANRLVYASDKTIAFSAIDDPHSFDAVDYHELPTGATITGITELGGTLLVFTTAGIWTISGLQFNIVDDFGNGQHKVDRLSEAIFLAGVAGIAGHEQQLVIPATDGIYLLDGVSAPTRISRGIESVYRGWIRNGYRLGKAVVFGGHYILPICSALGTVRDMFVCRLDRPVKTRFDRASWPWVRFSGDGGEIPAFTIRHGSTQMTPVLLGVQGRDNAKLVDCTDFFNPDSLLSNDSDGTAFIGQIVTRDYESGNQTVNAVRSMQVRAERIGGSIRTEWSEGGPNRDIPGFSNPLRPWGDPEAEWGHADGRWGIGFGPENPDDTPPPSSGPTWIELSPTNPVTGDSDGITPVKFRVNQRTRYSRYRITTSGPVENFRLRALDFTTRPSQAVRR